MKEPGQLRPYEHALVRESHAPEFLVGQEERLPCVFDFQLAIAAIVFVLTVYSPHLVVCTLEVDTPQHIVGSEHIARVEKEEPLTRGMVDALVHRIVNTLVGLTHPEIDVRVILSQHLHRMVCASPIDYDILTVGKFLTDVTVDCSLELFGVVEADGYDR